MQRAERARAEALARRCRLCLHAARAAGALRGREAAGAALLAAGDLPWSWEDALVCWECKAELRRIERFKRQALQARQLLEQAQTQLKLTNSLELQSLSRLAMSTKIYFDAEFYSDDSYIPNSPKWQDYKDIVPKIEMETDEYVSDCDVWADTGPAELTTILNDQKCDTVEESTAEILSEGVENSRKKKQKRCKGRPVMETDVVKCEFFTPSESDLYSYRNRAYNNLQRFSFSCVSCIKGFVTEEKLQKHNDKYHSEGAGEQVCETCKCRFQTAELLSNHLATHSTMYRCTYSDCDFMHPLSVKVRMHYAAHRTKKSWKKTPGGPFQCDICEKMFQTDRNLKLHRETHVSKKVYECDHCGKIMNTRLQLLSHMPQHVLKLMCDMCGKRCKTKNTLKMHRLAHLDPSHRPFECDVCHKRFIDKYKLLVHSRQHTGEKPFQCESCSTAYASKEQLTQHVKKHHLPEEESRTKFRKPRTKSFFRNERIFPGKQQKRIQVKQETQSREFQVTGNSYQCNICGKKLSTQQNLQSHFVVHSNERPVKCDECEKTFKYKPQLYAHKLRHRGDKPHQCTVCGARFGFKNILNAHLKTHSNERAFKCDECDLTFKYNSGLWTHKLIHKGEKPHQCTICGSRFTLKGNLTGHMKTHTNDKPFECNVCGRKFPWRRNLKNHYKTHAKEQRALDVQ